MATSTTHRTKITGVCPPAHAFAIAQLVAESPATVWLIIHEEPKQTDSLGEDITLFHQARGSNLAIEVMAFPEAQTSNKEMREAFNAASDRLSVLSQLSGLRRATHKSGSLLILATPTALLQPVPPPEDFASREI